MGARMSGRIDVQPFKKKSMAKTGQWLVKLMRMCPTKHSGCGTFVLLRDPVHLSEQKHLYRPQYEQSKWCIF